MKIENLIKSGEIGQKDQDPLRQHKVHEAAEKFEAVLLGEMLKPLANKGEDGEEQGGGVMASYGLESLAGAMAKHGGLGFAHRMEMRFEHAKSPSAEGQK